MTDELPGGDPGSGEPKDPIDAYDSKHGDPSQTPDKPTMSDDDSWGEKLNPVRETNPAWSNLKEVGK